MLGHADSRPHRSTPRRCIKGGMYLDAQRIDAVCREIEHRTSVCLASVAPRTALQCPRAPLPRHRRHAGAGPPERGSPPGALPGAAQDRPLALLLKPPEAAAEGPCCPRPQLAHCAAMRTLQSPHLPGTRPWAPYARRRSRPPKRKSAHRGLSAFRRPASAKTRLQVPVASGENASCATIWRRTPLLPQGNPQPGRQFPTRNQAGIAAACAFNPISMTPTASNPYGTEYSGFVYQNHNGTYSYTNAYPGTVDRSGPSQAMTYYPQTPVAWFHTHGGYDPSYGKGNYVFSDGPPGSMGDIPFSNSTGKPNCMANPANNVQVYRYTIQTRNL